MKAITLSFCLLVLTMSALAETPPMPKTPAAVDDIVYARPFSLEKGFKFFWRKERPEVTEGLILVLKADKALLVPRAAMMPVLYVGDQTAQRLNHGQVLRGEVADLILKYSPQEKHIAEGFRVPVVQRKEKPEED
jgi:hypothetical protein